MKKIIYIIGFGFAFLPASAQLVNNGNIHISNGAVMSVGMEVVNNGLVQNQGNLELKNNLTNNAQFQSQGTLVVKSDAGIQMAGRNAVEVGRLQLESDLHLKTSLNVSESLDFNSGVIFTEEGKAVNFGPNATHRNSSDFSHIVGSVSKTGTGDFVFPVGDGYNRKAFEVAEVGGRTIRANYVAQSPLEISSEMAPNVAEVNQDEYWTLKADNATRIDVKLANAEVVTLEQGAWTSPKRGLVASTEGIAFTSGRGKNIVKEIGVWPNPTAGEFNLKLLGMNDNDNITVDITNQDGRVVQTLEGKVKDLRKAYRLPNNLSSTSLKVRVINGEEVLTQTLLLNK